MVVSGFGSFNKSDGPSSPKLKKLYSTIISLRKCQKSNTALILDSNICTKSNLINENSADKKYEATCSVSNKDT